MQVQSSSAILPSEPLIGPGEEAVINQNECGAVRALWRKGVAKKAIARQLGLDIKTVRKWVRAAWHEQKRKRRGSRLDEWRSFLEGRAPEVGWNGSVLMRELGQMGYGGSYASLRKYIAPWRKDRPENQATVRFETAPCEQSQVDWGQTWIYLAEARVKVHI